MGCCCSTSRWACPATTHLQKAKWLLRAEKAGHTGTLDPLATGVLPLCFGAATKFSQLHLDADKTYEAVAVSWACAPATGDAEGEVIAERDVPAITPQRWRKCRRSSPAPSPGAADAQRAEEGRQGPVRIRPAGIEVERERANVTIHALRTDLEWPDRLLRFVAKVSKGTYIRTLGEDIGEALGCGAHLSRCAELPRGRSTWRNASRWKRWRHGEETRGRAAAGGGLLPGHTHVTLGMEDAGRFLSRPAQARRLGRCRTRCVFGDGPAACPPRHRATSRPAS
jgi:tRNA pseudouridine55 synthase